MQWEIILSDGSRGILSDGSSISKQKKHSKNNSGE